MQHSRFPERPPVRRGAFPKFQRVGICLSVCVLSVSAFAAPQDPPLRCGSHCLFIAGQVFGKGPSYLSELEAVLGQPSERGYSLKQLEQAALSFGLHAISVETSVENLREREKGFCCIVHLDGGHFVMVSDIADGQCSLVDPPRTFSLPVTTFQSRWSGTALLISDEPLQSESALNTRRLWQWLGWNAIVGIVVTVIIFAMVFAWRSKRRA